MTTIKHYNSSPSSPVITPSSPHLVTIILKFTSMPFIYEQITAKRAANPEYDRKRKIDNAVAAKVYRQNKKTASTSNPAETEPMAGVARPNFGIIPSMSSPLHCKLGEMMSLWEKLYPSTRQDHGLKVFRKLFQMPLESLPTFEVKFSKMPTAAHLFRDLFADDGLQYKSCLNERDEGCQTDFIAAWAGFLSN